jgi:hypothetical protein
VSLIVSLGLKDHPWVVPAFLLWCAVLAVGWVMGHRAAVRRGEVGPRAATVLFWCAVGVMLAVTLTPGSGSVDFGYWDRHVSFWGHSCLPQWPRTGFGLWAPNPERRANVLLGVPLGMSAGFCGGARGWAVTAPVIALLLPGLVELGQAALPLNRVCAVLDVVDNVSGVLIGLAVAFAVSLMLNVWARNRPRRPAAPKPLP